MTYIHCDRNGDKFRGRWHYDDKSKQWMGNPVLCAEVDDMYEACKNKDGEGERHHSRAISLDDMKKLLAFSRQECPIDLPVTDLASLALKGSHLWFNAFASTGFTIWTR